MFHVLKFWIFYICIYIIVIAIGYFRGEFLIMNSEQMLMMGVWVGVSTFVLGVISRVLLMVWDTKRIIARFLCLLVAALIFLFVIRYLQGIVY
jgi:hypothetical protein